MISEESQKPKKSETPPESVAPHVRMHLGNTEVVILGTAHISPESVSDVRNFFHETEPRTVCVELCQSRYDAMRDPERWRKLDLAAVIKQKKLGLLFSSLILSSFQKKVGESTGVKPGDEMLLACDLSEGEGRTLVLADREIRTTLSRSWNKVGFFSKMWLLSNLVASLLVKEDVDPEQIERMKREDVLTDLFSTLPRRYDEVKRVIVDERDLYLAESIRKAAADLDSKEGGGRLLAVVGAGHLKGIEQTLQDGVEVSLNDLETIPKRTPWRAIAGWVLFSLILMLVSYYVSKDGWEAAEKTILAWVLGRSIGAGVGAILAGAHILTILVSIVMAPLTIFIPGSRLWMFASLTELWTNKPQVEDFENIASDTDTFGDFFRSLYRNRVLKLFWIITLVSTGLFIGNLHFLGTVLNGLLEYFNA